MECRLKRGWPDQVVLDSLLDINGVRVGAANVNKKWTPINEKSAATGEHSRNVRGIGNTLKLKSWVEGLLLKVK